MAAGRRNDEIDEVDEPAPEGARETFGQPVRGRAGMDCGRTDGLRTSVRGSSISSALSSSSRGRDAGMLAPEDGRSTKRRNRRSRRTGAEGAWEPPSGTHAESGGRKKGARLLLGPSVRGSSILSASSSSSRGRGAGMLAPEGGPATQSTESTQSTQSGGGLARWWGRRPYRRFDVRRPTPDGRGPGRRWSDVERRGLRPSAGRARSAQPPVPAQTCKATPGGPGRKAGSPGRGRGGCRRSRPAGRCRA